MVKATAIRSFGCYLQKKIGVLIGLTDFELSTTITWQGKLVCRRRAIALRAEVSCDV